MSLTAPALTDEELARLEENATEFDWPRLLKIALSELRERRAAETAYRPTMSSLPPRSLAMTDTRKWDGLVRPLVWEVSPTGMKRAMSLLGVYAVWTHHEAGGDWFWTSAHIPYDESVGSEAEAVAACNYHYANTILSALNLDALDSPAHKPVVAAALRDELRAGGPNYRDDGTRIQLMMISPDNIFALLDALDAIEAERDKLRAHLEACETAATDENEDELGERILGIVHYALHDARTILKETSDGE